MSVLARASGLVLARNGVGGERSTCPRLAVASLARQLMRLAAALDPASARRRSRSRIGGESSAIDMCGNGLSRPHARLRSFGALNPKLNCQALREQLRALLRVRQAFVCDATRGIMSRVLDMLPRTADQH